MSKQIGSFKFRSVVEQTFAGLAFAATITVISAGTLVMCFPGLGIA